VVMLERRKDAHAKGISNSAENDVETKGRMTLLLLLLLSTDGFSDISFPWVMGSAVFRFYPLKGHMNLL